MTQVARAIVSSPERRLATEAAWSEFLARELRRPVRVTFTRARKLPLCLRPLRADGVELRIHALFAGAPPEVGAAVASWARSGKRAPRACRLVDDYVARGLRALPPPASRAALVARGHAHDLGRLTDELCTGELSGAAFPRGRPRVGWGRRDGPRARRSLRLGCYDPDGHLVRIHPVLDQPGVPAWFVRFILFHELLHALHPAARARDDRWIHHGREFRARERCHADYRRALAWERANLDGLLRAAQRGEPFRPRHGPAPERRERLVAAPARPRPATVLRAVQRWLFPDATA